MPGKRVTKKQRAQVIEWARNRCEYCRCPDYVSADPFSIDHILPSSKGGETTLNNLAYSCLGCNYEKSDRVKWVDPLTLKKVRLFNPRRQKWADHFGWNHNFTKMIGLTATGRATIEALDLNRVGVINLRKALRQEKKHPP